MGENVNSKGEDFNYRTLFEQNLAGLYQTTAKGIILNCNEAFARMLKYSSCDELTKTNAFALYFSQIDRDTFIETVRKRKRLLNYESVLKCKDGSPLYVIENIFLRTDHETGEELCEGIIIDISERKLAEIEFKEINLKYKALFENPLNALIVTDNKGDIVDVNNAACELFGYTKEEFLKLNRVNIIDIRNEDYTKAMIRRKKTGMSQAEIIAINKNGKHFPIAFVSSVFFNAKGEERRSSLIIDITERKKLEEKVEFEKTIKQKEITEAVITAQELERSQIGRELHDNVNQLLTAAKLYTDMAKTDEENKIAFLNSASSYTVTAIDEIRKLSKTLITPLIKDIGLKDSIKALTEEIIRVHPLAIFINTNNFNEENLNEKYKLNVFRIVQEQLNNIIKHANSKSVKINFEETKTNITITILDDGIGFDTKKRKEGIGISNIISRAELYKGEVTIKSEPDKGCSLTVDFIKSNLIIN